jgi:hypothetical protein
VWKGRIEDFYSREAEKTRRKGENWGFFGVFGVKTAQGGGQQK